MPEQFVILCCENIRPEVDAVLATGAMPKAAARSFPFHCGHVRSVWETVKQPVGELEGAGDTICLCGCGCQNTFDIPKDVMSRPSLALVESGPQLFLPVALYEEFHRCGAYLVLPGWLSRWKQNMERDGLDPSTAREMFGESVSAIVLLDTGLWPDIAPVLSEFAEFCGLPARVFPVGTDHLRFRLAALYNAWDCGQEMKACRVSVNAAEKRVADFSMVADLTGRLVGIHDEKKAVMQVLDFIVQLFCPERTGFLPVHGTGRGETISVPTGAYPDPGHFDRAFDPACRYQVSETGDGYLFPVRYNEDLIGILSVDGVSLPGSLDEYINLTHFIGQVAGLSITIARTHDDLMLAMKAREIEIAERIRVELALRESEEKYRTLVESSFDGIAIHQDGILVYVNQTAARLLGAGDPSVFIGKPAIDIVAPGFRGQVAERVKQAPGRTMELMREQFVRLDGTLIDVDVTTAPSIWEGKPAAYVTFRDITAQMRAENALRESEEKFRALVETTSDFIWEVDGTGRYTYVSPQVQGLLGYDPAEIIGKTPFDLMDPSEARRVRDEFDRLASTHLPIMSLENQCIHRDGHRVVLETSGVPRYGKDGSFAGYRGIDRDITRRKESERALAESEERYRTIIENIQDVYFRINRDGRIEMVSPSAALTFGYASLTDMIGMPILTLWKHPDQRTAFLDAMKKQGGAVQDWEAEFKKSDGTGIWVSISAHLRTGEQGENPGTEGIIRDISGRKKMEEALKNALTKLNMLSSITRHDILNQITGLRTFLELSKEDLKGTKHEMFIEKEDRAAEAIQRQIEFTRYYQDIGVNAPKWQDAGAVIRDAIGQLSPAGIDIRVNVSGIEIFADPLIIKVFFNLMENSLRHGERVTQMFFSAEKSVEGLVITYRDNGVGISEEDKKKLFRKGFGKHTGLGLFLSREILAITGITIVEKGEPGKGVQFEITIPYGAFRASL